VDKYTDPRDDARVVVACAYELRRGDEILSTGRLTAEQELAPGDEVAVASVLASVTEVVFQNGEARLILEPVPG
jgi:hypothetical protein